MKFFRALVCWLIAFPLMGAAKSSFTFCASEQNDLFLAVKKSGASCLRVTTPLEAVQRARDNAVVFIMAEKYPAETVAIEPEVYELAARKNLRLYVEYPSAVPGISFDSIHATTWERGVVSSDTFGSSLPQLSILAVHDCHYLRCVAPTPPWLVIARVAGFDTAVYGLPKERFPLLFEVPEKKMIVATAKLSNFVTARYAPSQSWAIIWNAILDKLDPAEAPHAIKWTPAVAPAFTASAKLPSHYQKRAFDAAAQWFFKSQLLVTPLEKDEVAGALRKGAETRPLPRNIKKSVGDGSFGILEGYASGIQSDGTQLQRLPLRADCNAESAMVLALDSFLNHNKSSAKASRNLLDFVYFNSGMCQGVRSDPKHPAFGLIAWGDIAPAWIIAHYGDDNARTLQATIFAAACLGSEKWNDAIVKGLIANLRTTGKLGFRGDRIDIPALEQNGWKHFHDTETVNIAPHFETGLWACYVWAYQQTKFAPFLEKAKTAVQMTMKAYPDGWRFRDQMERARMLLTLAWLVRVDDTPEHRQWVKLVATDLLKHQSSNGAVHEWLGGTGGGHYHIPQSNEAYGTGETPLIQQNGDPATDQLYSTGFSLLGLHEAAAATSDPELRQAEDKLAEFLCRIQVRSKRFPFLDGWWFRAFDDKRWEYWASSADVGWGAWSMESGWGQAWTAIALGLREMKTTYWDFTSSQKISSEFEKWQPQMLPQ